MYIFSLLLLLLLNVIAGNVTCKLKQQTIHIYFIQKVIVFIIDHKSFDKWSCTVCEKDII